MKLLIISGMPHYKTSREIVGWAPTAQEISWLSKMFDDVVHIARLYDGDAPKSFQAYDSEKIKFIPVAPSGGKRFLDKIKVIWCIPGYIKQILKWLPRADVVHVRCPDNISMVAMLLLIFIKNPKTRWIKYAGNWQPKGKEPWSYRFQRWLLSKPWHGAQVTVNGEWAKQPEHIHPFLNPCVTLEECCSAGKDAGQKEIGREIKLIFVGRLEEEKGVGRILEIAKELCKRGTAFRLDLIGDGQQRKEYEKKVCQLGLDTMVSFCGWLSPWELRSFYKKAHIQLLPSASEGWPKVLSEAMVYGVIPLASNVSCIPFYLEKFKTGCAIPPESIMDYVEKIVSYSKNPNAWKKESENAILCAREFTYEKYLENVKILLGLNA